MRAPRRHSLRGRHCLSLRRWPNLTQQEVADLPARTGWAARPCALPTAPPAFLAMEPSRFLMGRQLRQLLAQRSGGVSFLRIMRLERAIRDGRQTDRQTRCSLPRALLYTGHSQKHRHLHTQAHTLISPCVFTLVSAKLPLSPPPPTPPLKTHTYTHSWG